MGSIKDIIPQVMGEMAGKRHHSQERLEGTWQGILEKGEAKHTKIAGIKEGKVFVWVDSPAWLYHMKTRQAKTLERFQKEWPDIQSIHFKIGRV